MIGRRTVVSYLAAMAASGAAIAQPASGRTYRLGALVFTSTSLELIRSVTLPALAALGFVEGRNLVLDARRGAPGDMPRLAAALLEDRPDAILTIGNVAAAAARGVTSTTPIVFFGSDAVELGWADSLARPAANITGILMLGPDLDAKRLQLMREAVPRAGRLAALIQPVSPNADARRRAMRDAAAAQNVQIVFVDASGPESYASAVRTIHDAGAEGVVVGSDPIFLRDIDIIMPLLKDARLPTICHWREMTQRGCLFSYGPNLRGMYQRTAEILARIFAGTRPGDIPIETPSRFEFVVHLSEARALGLTVPPAILARADEVIE